VEHYGPFNKRAGFFKKLTLTRLQVLIALHYILEQGRIQGEAIGAIVPPKTYESNFFHHNIVQARKQHSRHKASFSFIVLSQQCCEVYFISFTVAKPLGDLTTKYY